MFNHFSEIPLFFLKYINKEISIKNFEKNVYTYESTFESFLEYDDYYELISLNYNNSNASTIVKNILFKYISKDFIKEYLNEITYKLPSDNELFYKNFQKKLDFTPLLHQLKLLQQFGFEIREKEIPNLWKELSHEIINEIQENPTSNLSTLIYACGILDYNTQLTVCKNCYSLSLMSENESIMSNGGYSAIIKEICNTLGGKFKLIEEKIIKNYNRELSNDEIVFLKFSINDKILEFIIQNEGYCINTTFLQREIIPQLFTAEMYAKLKIIYDGEWSVLFINDNLQLSSLHKFLKFQSYSDFLNSCKNKKYI